MSAINLFLDRQLPNQEFSLSPLAGDASSRRYYRVLSENKSWVLMEWEPFSSPQEFPFLSVQQYFSKHEIQVPHVHGYDADKGLFLLEDLGDLTLERRFWEFQNQEVVIPFYKKTLDQLIKIHSLSFEDQGDRACTAYQTEFSVEKLVWEMNYAKKYLLKELLALDLPTSLEVNLEQEFIQLCQSLYASPQVICHRDFHSRNVMLHFNDLVIIDFQDARLGPPVYDLVSLFCDSYVELDDSWVQQLMDYYIENFRYFDALNLNREAFLDLYQQQIIQRCFKACGSFASFKVTRDDKRYLSYIQPTLERVLNQLSQTSFCPTLREVLEKSRTQWESL